MYTQSYREQLAASGAAGRDGERRALERSLVLLEAARAAGAGSPEAVAAVHATVRLWSVLVEDLALPGNGLPPELRAGLVSVGLWVLRRCEDIRQGRDTDFDGLIAVTATIRDGLA